MSVNQNEMSNTRDIKPSAKSCECIKKSAIKNLFVKN